MNQLARPTDISRSCSGCVKMIRALSNSNFKFQNFKFQISKLHIPSFHMNQLACPTDISRISSGCVKMIRALNKGGNVVYIILMIADQNYRDDEHFAVTDLNG